MKISEITCFNQFLSGDRSVGLSHPIDGLKLNLRHCNILLSISHLKLAECMNIAVTDNKCTEVLFMLSENREKHLSIVDNLPASS